MAKLKTGNTEMWAEYCKELILQLRSYPVVIRYVKKAFGLTYLEARQAYELALTDAKNNDDSRITKNLYIDSLLEFKSRCIDAEDRDNERRILHDLGKALNYIGPDINVDNQEIESKEDALLQELINKYKTDDLPQ